MHKGYYIFFTALLYGQSAYAADIASHETEQSCLAKHGHWGDAATLVEHGAGIHHWICIMRTKDAGKSCKDGKECESRACVADVPYHNSCSPEVKGVCYEESLTPLGCLALFKNGKCTVTCAD